MEELIIYTDGASRGNPGKAGLGVVAKDKNGREVKIYKKYLGVQTNNYAEYKAVFYAFRIGVIFDVKKLIINSDSELVIKQLRGEYKVKNQNLKPIYEDIKKMENKFLEVKYNHIYRDKNFEADKLANEAIDEGI